MNTERDAQGHAERDGQGDAGRDSHTERDGQGDGQGPVNCPATEAPKAPEPSSRDWGRRGAAQIHVTIDLETLLGLRNHPATIRGAGPIPAEVARAIAYDPTSTWSRLVTEPLTGHLLDQGRKRWAPPQALADFVRARDLTCTHPGCRRPAGRCDLDHLIPYPRGETSQANLHALCKRHHRLKHEGGWKHTLSTNPGDPPGTTTVTTPTGRTYTQHRPAIGVTALAPAPAPAPAPDLGPPPF